MSTFSYKNPTSSTIIFGPTSVTREDVTGTNFSVNGIGGYMEVFRLSDLNWTIPTGTTSGTVYNSGNTIPIHFNVGSPNQLYINDDQISTGRRRLGMLVYVYENNKLYQFNIPNYETLWNNANTSGSITDIGTGYILQNDSNAGLVLMSAWTGSTIEGISGYTSSNANWIYPPNSNDLYITGLTFNNSNYNLTIGRNDGWSATQSLAILASDQTITGGTYNPTTGVGTFTNNTGGTFTVSGFLTGYTDTNVTGGTYSNGNVTFTNSSGGTFTVSGFSTGNTTIHWYSENSASPSISPTATGTGSIAIGDGARAAANYMFVYGNQSGSGTTQAPYAVFLGYNAGLSANKANNSNFLGQSAGQSATNASNSNFFGTNAGKSATSASGSNFFGQSAGQSATIATSSYFFGNSAGSGATNANNSNFFGNSAGYLSTGGQFSNFFGNSAGYGATSAQYSNFFGRESGYNAVNASYSNLFGAYVGKSFTGNDLGSNNIIIGKNISLPNGASDSINIGGVLFGINTYTTLGGDPSIQPTSNGKIGIGVVTSAITNTLHVSGSSNPLRLEGLSGVSIDNPSIVTGKQIGRAHV